MRHLSQCSLINDDHDENISIANHRQKNSNDLIEEKNSSSNNKNDEIHTQREKEMKKKKKNNKKLIIIIKCVYHVYLRCVSDYKITHAMSGLCILYSMNAKCNNEENRKFHHNKVALNSL